MLGGVGALLLTYISYRAINTWVIKVSFFDSQLTALGLVGGALARTAWTGFLAAAREIAEQGTFTHLSRAVPFAEVNEAFRVRQT